MTDDEAVKMFETAYSAYHAEMRVCLRDRKLWVKQVLLGLFGVVKTVVVLILLPMVVFGSLGLPSVLGLTMGLIVIPIILMAAPDKICVNLFQQRAWLAFDEELARLRLAANQKAPTRIDA